MEKLQFIKVFDTGFISKIELYIKRDENRFLAKKIIDKSQLSPQKKKQIDNEIKIIRGLNDHYIIQYENVLENLKYYIILMEFFSGKTVLDCLKSYILKYKKPFPEKFVQFIIREIARGIKVLHRNDIILRDFTNESIFVKFYNENDIIQTNMLGAHIKIGRLKNAATIEQLNNDSFYQKYKFDKLYEQSRDIYTLGLLCSEMLFGTIIRNKQELLNLKNNQINYKIPSELSLQIFDFLELLRYANNQKVTIDNVLNHQFLNGKIEQFKKIKIVDLLDNGKLNKITIPNKGDDFIYLSSMFSNFSKVSERSPQDNNKYYALKNVNISPFQQKNNINNKNNINQNNKNSKNNQVNYINNPNQSKEVININNNPSQQNQNINLIKNKTKFELSHSSLYSSEASIINNSSSQTYGFSGLNSSINNNLNINNINQNHNNINYGGGKNIINKNIQSAQNINNNIKNSNNYQNLSLKKLSLQNSDFYKNNNLHISYRPVNNMNNNFKGQLYGSNIFNNININKSSY